MERMRAFVALNLPIAAIDEIAKVQVELREAASQAGGRVAWIPPPNMHVTLKFLGEIPAEAGYAVRDCLGDQLARRPAWRLDVRGVGVFPNDQQPRVLWVGLHDPDAHLTRLAADVDRWLEEFGFAPERRPFHPHLTVGRIKQRTKEFWSPWAEHEVTSCVPNEVVFYRSVLQQQGAEYTALARYGLHSPDKQK